MFLETPTLYSENLAVLIFDDFASNWVYLILVGFIFDSIAAQSFDITETTLPVYTGTSPVYTVMILDKQNFV